LGVGCDVSLFGRLWVVMSVAERAEIVAAVAATEVGAG
jgi:hypothetical protein